MKILHTVESYDPANNGMQQVVKQISERLVSAGHQVTVATGYDKARNDLLINGVRIEQFRISGKGVGGIFGNEHEKKRYLNFLTQSDFDIITNFAAQQWATDLALPVLRQIKAAKVIVPTGFSELQNKKWNKYFDSMKTWMQEYDMNVFLSNDYQDINFARKNEVKKIVVIPNGASEEEFMADSGINVREELKIPGNHFLILHVGSHTGLKGHREAIRIFKKARIKNATLLIIGNPVHSGNSIISFFKFFFKSIANIFSVFSGKHFVPACYLTCQLREMLFKFSYARLFQNKILITRDLHREKTVAAYKEADLFLFPSNIECSPLVLFESMASQTPFLTTDVGNAREIISWSGAGILLPTVKLKDGKAMANVKKSAGVLEKLIPDRTLQEEMKINGFRAFKENFNWDKITKEYERLYYSLITKEYAQ